MLSRNYEIGEREKLIDGPFEVHVVVELADEPLLQQWILRNQDKRLFNLKITGFLAFYGRHPLHVMATFYVSGSAQHAMGVTKDVVESLTAYGLHTLRVKVEANLNAANAPGSVEGNSYYEYHLKVPVKDMEEWERLASLCEPFGGHLFLNNRSKTKGTHAIVTVRKYNVTRENFDTKTLPKIIADGFQVVSSRFEYGVYDSNPLMDSGWIFDTDPYST